jgi:DNA-binding NarL/FixJ family response regulator
MDRRQAEIVWIGSMSPLPQPPEHPITVLLVEDHDSLRNKLLALLALESDLRIVSQAADGRQAVMLAGKLSPDVVVMDISMPLLDGLEAMRQILQARPTTQVIMLSSYNEDFFVEHARALGAAGYLFKQTCAHLLPQAIREVYRKKAFFNPMQAATRTEPQNRGGRGCGAFEEPGMD